MKILSLPVNGPILVLPLLAWWLPLTASETYPPLVLADTSFACNDLVHISLGDNCEAFIEPDEIVEGYNGDFNDLEVAITDEFGFPVNNPVTGAYIGTMLTVTVTHVPSGLSCWGEALIEDKWPPMMVCSDVQVPCFQNPNSIPFPIAFDNCDANPSVTLAGTSITQGNPCVPVTITRTFFATDDYGNISEPCVQTVTLTIPPLPDFPEDTIWTCEIYNAFSNVTGATPLTGNLSTTGSGVPDVAQGDYCPHVVAHEDFIISGCGETFTILRTWTVIDWCAGEIITVDINGDDNIQLIKVADEVPPVVVIQPFTVGTNMATVCRSMGFLPPAQVSDNCHNWTQRILTPIGEAIYTNGQNGNNGGIIPSPGLPLGDHTVIYEVKDECGNIDTAQVTVTVADLTAPVAVCDEITNVSLGNLGFAELFAGSLDDGSYDNCCLDSFLVRRMDTQCDSNDLIFHPSVTFCCEDVGTPVIVVFRALDCFGNYNECMVTVEVEEKIPPVLVSCPPEETITCIFYADSLEIPLAEGNFDVLNQFGTPVFQDNCELIFLVDTVFQNLDQCLQGNILRTWQVTDPGHNNTLTCTQNIVVAHVSNWVVEFPADITVTCTDTLPPTGEPEIFFDDCELIATSFEDVLFTVVPDACFKIVRTWTVINWCVVGTLIDQEVVESPESVLNFDLNGDGVKNNRTFQDGLNASNFNLPANLHGALPDGFITYQQVLKVIDDTDPVVSCPNEIEICIEESDCDVTFELPLPSVDDCSTEITITANGDLGSGLGPFIDVPPGSYQTTYFVSDNCNNTTACNTTVIVKDCKDPTPICLNGLSIALAQDTIVVLLGEQFDAGSYDNCPGELIFSFSADTSDTMMEFDCSSLGFVYVQIWLTDAAGNQDYCETIVIVDDNNGACAGLPLIAGEIKTENNNPVGGVHVGLNGTAQGMEITGNDGKYVFEVPNGGDYTLAPSKDVSLLNGVTTYDLVLITKLILGTQLLDSPYKIIAADVNKSNSVTTADLVALRKVILQATNAFPNNTSWRFVDKSYVFPDPANPFSASFPEIVNFNDLGEDCLNANYIGIKIGDVNLSADAQN